MPVILNLSDKRAKAMLKVYVEEKKLLYSKLEEIKVEIKEIDFLTNEILKVLGEDVVESNGQSELFSDHKGKNLSYNPRMSKAKKAQWAIKLKGVPLNIHEIIDVIEEKEPHLFIGERDVKRRDYTNQVASPIGTQAREGKVFFREKKEEDTYYKYGLLEWKGEIPKNTTYLGHIVRILEKKNRFLYSVEMTNIIAKHNNVKNIEWLKKRISAALSKAKKDKEVAGLIKYKSGSSTKDIVWGYDYWLDKNGNIKREYMFKDK